MDPSLIVHKFHPFVEKQPLNVHYQEYSADQASRQSCNWNIDSPFAGALLDNEVLVEWTFTGARVPLTTQFVNGGNGVGVDQGAGGKTILDRVCFAQGFPFVSALAKMECVINGQSLRTSPSKYIPEFTRFYSHPMETQGIATLAGGELDDNSCGPLTDGSAWDFTLDTNAGARSVKTDHSNSLAALPDEVIRPRFPIGMGTRHVNQGYAKRYQRFWERTRVYNGILRNIDEADDDADYKAQDPTYQLFERLPLSPFLMFEAKDGKRSIPYVDKMEITMTFHANHLKHALQGNRFAQTLVGAADFGNWFSENARPKLHLRWYIPPPGMVLEPEISIPISVYKETSIPVTGLVVDPRSPDGNKTYKEVPAVNYSNIRLQQIPDMIFIYAKPTAAAMELDFNPEHHLAIESIEITINGDSGKLLRASKGELFSMYVRNSPMSKERLYDFDTWFQKYCTCVFVPSDLGVRVPPGVNHGVTLDVRVEFRQYWTGPTIWNWGAAEKSLLAPQNRLASRFPDGQVDVVGNLAAITAIDDPATRNVSYEMHVISVYDKYELTLTNRGNAQLKLQNVPSLDLPQQVAAVDQADLRAQFA